MLLGVWAIAATLIGGAAPAHATPGALDRSFGHGGKTLTAVDLDSGWDGASIQAAIAPNGDILVAAGARLARYLPEGRLDPNFGDGGLLKIELPGGLGFSLGDLAVDPHGAAVVIGTATDDSAPRSSSSAAFLRYRNDGSPDPSFGGDGVMLTNFGLQASATDPSAPPVTATLGAVDSAGRVIAVGGALRPFLYCAHGDIERRDELIARLTPDGQLDPTFGDGGIRLFSPSLRMTGMALGEAGESTFAGMPGNCLASPELAVACSASTPTALRPSRWILPRFGTSTTGHGR